MLQGLTSCDAIRRVDLEHFHEEIHRYIHHPLFPLASDEHLSERSWLDKRNILHITVHLLQALNHRFRSEEGAELHQLVILIKSRFLVKQRISSWKDAHKHNTTRPNIQSCGLVNHLWQNLRSAEALGAGRMRKTCTGRIIADGATAIRVLEMLDDVDNEPHFFFLLGLAMDRLHWVYHFWNNSFFNLSKTKIDEDANTCLFGISTMKYYKMQYKKLRGLMSRWMMPFECIWLTAWSRFLMYCCIYMWNKTSSPTSLKVHVRMNRVKSSYSIMGKIRFRQSFCIVIPRRGMVLGQSYGINQLSKGCL